MDATRQALHALIVEDNLADAELIVEQFRLAGYDLDYTRVETEADYVAALDTAPEVILCDYTLPRFSGLRALALLHERSLDIPFILVSGTVGEDLAVDAMVAGARDYVLKDRLTRLVPAVQRELRACVLRHEERRLRAALDESERKSRATFNQAAVGIVRADLDRNILDANQKFCELTGYNRDELLCMTVLQISHPEDRGQDTMQRAQLLAGEFDHFRSEKRYLRKDGGIIWVRRTTSLARDAATEEPHYIIVVEDITDRKTTEESYRATFERAPVGIMHSSLDSNILHANPKLCEILGYTREELLTMTLADIIPPDHRGIEQAKFLAPILTGKIEHFSSERPFLRKDGTIIWVNRHISLVRDAAGQPLYFLRTIEDISERKFMEDQLARERQLLRTVIDAMPDRIFVKDREGRFLLQNAANLKVRGLEHHDEIVGKTVFDIYPQALAEQRDAEDRAIIGSGLPLLNREGQTYFGDSDRRRQETRWHLTSKIPLRDAAGMIYGIAGINHDITEQKLAAIALQESERFAKSTIDTLSEHLCVLDDRGTIIAVNKAWREFALANGVKDYSHVAEGANYLAACEAESGSSGNQGPGFAAGIRAVLGGEREEFTLEYPCHSPAEQRWFSGKVTPFQGMGPRRVVVTHEDITKRKETQAALVESDEKFRELTRNIPQVFWITDAAQRSTIYASPAYETISGRSLSELESEPRSWLKTVHAEDRERVKSARKERALFGTYNIEYRMVHIDGSLRWIHDRAFPVSNAENGVYRIAGIAEDITERKQTQEQLAQLAHYDSLTGLPNRVLFNDRLRQAVAQARRNHWIVGVLFLDLDRFKLVNDTLGHASGDLLLKQVAARLSECLRPTDTVGRLSGDEFAVILSELAEAQNAGYVAQKILDALAAPFNLEGSEVFVTASIGITLYPSDSESIDTLIRDADAAMYGAKAAGRNNYQYYTAAMNARALEKLRLETGIRRALERNELLLHYQPKIDIASGNISGLEALLRWQSPEQGLVSPAQFIPLLEDSGLIVPVGEWVTRVVCAQLQAWRKAGVKPVPVAINLSARQLRQQGYAEVLGQAMQEYGIDPELIHVEITESSLMENPEEAILVLQELKTLGIRLEADDFGTGYSSLSYLKRFPLDALKIDRSFVRDITTDEDDAVIAKTVISLAHSLGLTVVAEGVETEEQLAFLSINRCDEAQGYLFAHPLPVDDCTALLGAGFPPCHRAAEGAERVPAILIVDDNAGDLELTRLSLQKDGHTILAAGSSHDAFKLLAGNSVGIVIADAKMPEMSGVKFLRQIKLMYPEVLRIMQSGTEDFSTAAAAINEGEVHKFFVKGQDNELLRREIKRKIWHAPGYHIPLRSAAPRRPGRPQRRLTSD